LSSLCGFTQDAHDTADWTHTKGHVSTLTGPKADHTYGTSSGQQIN